VSISGKSLVLLGLTIVGAPLSVHGDSIDTVTLTPVGPNTTFTIMGTYPADVPVTSFSSPDTSYSVTFSLPTTPTSLAFVDTVNGNFGVDTTVTVNSAIFQNSQLAFFTADQGGGVDVCLGEECSSNPPNSSIRWVIFGDQLFTGSLSAPVFIFGVAAIDPTQSFIESPVPEPSTFGLIAIGVATSLSALYRRRKREPSTPAASGNRQ